MPLLSWQLWLAREIVKDNPSALAKQQTDLTPGPVAQGFPAILAAIHTSSEPKPGKVSWLASGPAARRELATQSLKTA